MKVIAITNQKGGVAKTTTAINIADALMYMDYKVLFVDLDPQANSTSVYEGDTERPEEQPTIYELMHEEKSIRDCIEHTEFGDIIAGDERLAEQDAVFQTKIGGTKILKKAVKDIEDDYDFVIVDTPPNAGAYMQNAIYAADGCICPVTPKKFAVDGLSKLLNTINRIREDGNENLKLYGVLLTIYDMRNSQDKEIHMELPDLGEELGFHVFHTAIRTCQDVEKAIGAGESLFRTRGSSNGAMDYAGLVAELLEEV